MELRWYGRILRRQLSTIWRATALVAILAGLFTAYSFYGGRYKVATTVEFFQQQPIVGGQNINQDPLQLALAVAAQATGQSKFYTEQPSYFKSIAAQLKVQYGLIIDWRVIQTGLGANITQGRDLELEYTSSNVDTATEIVNTARSLVETDFLPTYNQTVVQPGKRLNITTFPIQVRIFDPTSYTTPHLSATAIRWFEESLVGLVLGVGLAFLWEYLDESIHDEHDVRNWMGTPTLGVIPGGKHRAA